MTDIQVPRAGTISKDGKNLAFYLDDYRLTIIDPYPSDVLFDEQYIYMERCMIIEQLHSTRGIEA